LRGNWYAWEDIRIAYKNLIGKLYYLDPCPNCMAHPQVVDGGDGFHLWIVAEYTLNKQSRTTDKG